MPTFISLPPPAELPVNVLLDQPFNIAPRSPYDVLPGLDNGRGVDVGRGVLTSQLNDSR